MSESWMEMEYALGIARRRTFYVCVQHGKSVNHFLSVIIAISFSSWLITLCRRKE